MIPLGESSAQTVWIDLNILLRTRMLLQANSGGGKSYAIRRIAEKAFGEVPIIILDSEGEFSTLREKYGYVLVGKGGDTPADCRSAGLVAHKLLELRASAVCDLYEMKAFERHRWVRSFLEAMIDAPKEFWRPTLVIVDEAHVFCMDSETEILTDNGFKKWNEVKPGDVSVCFDKGVYKNEAIQRVITKFHSGPMIHLQSDGIDQFVTSDHRVVLRRMQRAKGRFKLYDWTFCRAERVPNHVHVPTGGAPFGPGVPGLTADMARLLGWIITDGCFVGAGKNRKYLRYVGISQSKGTTKCGRNMVSELRSLLAVLGSEKSYERPARLHRRKDSRSFNSGPSVEFYLGKKLSTEVLVFLEGNLHRVPRRILRDGSFNQLQALYQGLVEGDGTSKDGCWRVFYPGNDEGLADDFQEIATRLGISVVKKQVPQTGQWTVLISRRKHHYIRKPKIGDYTGIVWDVTVPSGAFVARRRGKVFVTGNCPEKGAGESEASEAMIGLATRGRKRGFSCIFATQRLGKLRKDAAAELLNVLIGPTFIDIDRKRAAEALGVPKSDERKFFDELKVLDPGNFYALGRAISKELIRVKVGKVKTSHPEPGSAKQSAPPPTPGMVKRLLPKLADLPKEAESKAKTEAELRTEIRSLRAQMAARPKEVIQQEKIKTVEVSALKPDDLKALKKVVADMDGIRKKVEEWQTVLVAESGRIANVLRALETKEVKRDWASFNPVRPVQPERVKAFAEKLRISEPEQEDGEIKLLAGERRILQAAAQFHPVKRLVTQLATLSGFTASGGTFQNYWGRLRKFAFMVQNGDEAEITPAGLAYIGSDVPRVPSTVSELLDMWKSPKLLKGEVAILRRLVDAFGQWIPLEQLGEETGYTASGGTFQNYIGTLRRNGLAKVEDGKACMGDVFLEVGK